MKLARIKRDCKVMADRGKQITGLIYLVLLASCYFAWAFEIKDSNASVPGGQTGFAGFRQSSAEAECCRGIRAQSQAKIGSEY
ncbi:MAG TPA: hypothetical protein VN455_09350 [Methanotrichaceae archaeon]|nr:hypothetical protein [Methanotrichaceae archaeon]